MTNIGKKTVVNGQDAGTIVNRKTPKTGNSLITRKNEIKIQDVSRKLKETRKESYPI